MRKIILSLLAATALALPLAHDAAATYGGKPLAPDDPMLRSVIKLEVEHGSYTSFCTGVIVGPKDIATAAHCLFRMEEASEPIAAENFTVRYYYDKTVGRVGKMRYEKLNDLAVLTMTDRHPKGYLSPAQDLRPLDEIVKNSQDAMFIHFGHGPRSTGDPAALTRLDDKALMLQASNGVRLRMLHSNFPEPLGTCGGDSGGPVMIQDGNGTLKLVGIHQAGHKGHVNYAIDDSNGNCSRVSYFSPMSRLKKWVTELAAAERAGPRRLRTVSPEIIKLGKDAKPVAVAPSAPPPRPLDSPAS